MSQFPRYKSAITARCRRVVRRPRHIKLTVVAKNLDGLAINNELQLNAAANRRERVDNAVATLPLQL